MVGYDDPEYTADPAVAAAELIGYSMTMAEDRRRSPRDDIVTKLVHAQVDGGSLSPDEFGFFVILLAVAGAHFCLGASLARLEIDLIFNAIADRMPGIRRSGAPVRLRSGWLNGIKKLPVSYG